MEPTTQASAVAGGQEPWTPTAPDHSPTPELLLRALQSADDYRQAIELQRLVWGESFQEVVPAAILKVTQRVGGVCAGAFDEAGVLQGFVYGITGLDAGRRVHWSHMLAVRPGLRDRGIGQQLKQYQRVLLEDSGVEWLCWTFDPLVARNAHLNVNVLGVRIREYVADMYEGSGSPLHASGTDRLVAVWPVRENGVQPKTISLYDDAPLVKPDLLHAPVLRIEIPQDIDRLDLQEARHWRLSTREAFQACFGAGYEVYGFYRGSGDRCYYVMMQSAERTR